MYGMKYSRVKFHSVSAVTSHSNCSSTKAHDVVLYELTNALNSQEIITAC